MLNNNPWKLHSCPNPPLPSPPTRPAPGHQKVANFDGAPRRIISTPHVWFVLPPSCCLLLGSVSFSCRCGARMETYFPTTRYDRAPHPTTLAAISPPPTLLPLSVPPLSGGSTRDPRSVYPVWVNGLIIPGAPRCTIEEEGGRGG